MIGSPKSIMAKVGHKNIMTSSWSNDHRQRRWLELLHLEGAMVLIQSNNLSWDASASFIFTTPPLHSWHLLHLKTTVLTSILVTTFVGYWSYWTLWPSTSMTKIRVKKDFWVLIGVDCYILSIFNPCRWAEGLLLLVIFPTLVEPFFVPLPEVVVYLIIK